MLDFPDGSRPVATDDAQPLFFTPFVSSLMRIDPGWIDYNGHLNMAYYSVLLDRAMDEAFDLCGLGPGYPKARGLSYFLVESRLSFKRELTVETPARVTLQLIDVDDKRLHYVMEIREAREGWIAATGEHLSLHVDLATRRAAPFPDDVRAKRGSGGRARAARRVPAWPGLGIRIPTKHMVN
jgi:acyl-CoA thioester hydrolase